jgi:ABC-2 type transport system ATP-binding protein
MKTLLEIKGVTKIYHDNHHDVHALNNVHLTIGAGEVLALLGVNGAGKTTLSSIIATLHPPTAGDLLFKGASIYKDIATYRQAMGYCPQHPNLDSYLNVRDNLMFAGRYFLMPAALIKERVASLMEQFSLTKYAAFRVDALSGGYKQRLAIARALMHKPELVILDEPTVGLDPDIRRQLWNIIKELRERGITVILTTHYLDEAEELADRVCIMHRGTILLTETIESLKEKHQKATFEDIFLDLTRQKSEMA